MEYEFTRGAFLTGAAATLLGAPTVRSWRGSYRLPASAAAEGVSLELRAGRALVALAPGHASLVEGSLRRSGQRLRIVLPGRPHALVLDAVLRRDGRLEGEARQGPVRGPLRLAPGAPLDARAVAGYRLPGGETLALVGLVGHTYAVVYDHDEIRRLYRSGPAAWTVGAGVEARAPAAGTARSQGAGLRWVGQAASRLPVRELEVRFPARGAVLAGTLSLPAAAGRWPAAVLVHGSGLTPRSDETILAHFLASRGIATLVYDKRGVGQSGGRYPGEAASAAAIDAYAADAVAAVRFLAAQPEVDRARLGLAGTSQAGWVVPQAAVGEPAVRWVLLWSGPAVTQGESDLWGDLTGGGATAVARAAARRQVRAAGPSGVDPLPAIRRLGVPGLWLYGGLDMHVPAWLSV